MKAEKLNKKSGSERRERLKMNFRISSNLKELPDYLMIKNIWKEPWKDQK